MQEVCASSVATRRGRRLALVRARRRMAVRPCEAQLGISHPALLCAREVGPRSRRRRRGTGHDDRRNRDDQCSEPAAGAADAAGERCAGRAGDEPGAGAREELRRRLSADVHFKTPSGASGLRYVQSEALVSATVARAATALSQVRAAFASKSGTRRVRRGDRQEPAGEAELREAGSAAVTARR